MLAIQYGVGKIFYMNYQYSYSVTLCVTIYGEQFLEAAKPLGICGYMVDFTEYLQWKIN